MKYARFLILFSVALFACDTTTIPPGQSAATTSPPGTFRNTVPVEKRMVVRTHGAVGTIRPLTQTRIESQVSGQVLTVEVASGDRVARGQVLVTLDSRRLSARLEQAREGLAYAKNTQNQAEKAVDEAQAGLDQAHAAYLRTKTLFDKEVVPSQKLEIDRAGYLQAKARLEQAREGIRAARTGIRKAGEVVREANIALGYASIRSPAPGVVVERLIDPGDLAVPGKPLLSVQTSGSLRLEARVREGLIRHIILGNTYKVDIQTLGHGVDAAIEEIVPYADPATRTFLVKAALPDTPGVFPGMFGRLVIPVDREETLVIPEAALVRVGQLETVNVMTKDKGFRTVYVKAGRRLTRPPGKDGALNVPPDIEILSGLNGNETLGY